jgi:hypothetical protein
MGAGWYGSGANASPDVVDQGFPDTGAAGEVESGDD